MINKTIIDLTNSMIEKDIPLISNLSNLATILFDKFRGTSWFGFYLVLKEEDVLYLGPYRGPLACTKIKFGKGVCGESAIKKTPILVSDVSKIDNYIACSSSARSEVVVPIIKDSKVLGVIDLDSDNIDNYNEDDIDTLIQVSNIIKELF